MRNIGDYIYSTAFDASGYGTIVGFDGDKVLVRLEDEEHGNAVKGIEQRYIHDDADDVCEEWRKACDEEADLYPDRPIY